MADLGSTAKAVRLMSGLRPRSGPRRRSVRLQLTLIYSGLFLLSGIGLLALTYVLAATEFPITSRTSHTTTGSGGPGGTGFSPSPSQAVAAAAAAAAQSLHQRSAALHNLLMMSAIALCVMTVISIGLGWMMAGRMLRPVRVITNTARRISASSLHERLDMTGPEDELKELSDTFDALLRRLDRAFDAQRQFVANASHELRTPLARQRAFIEVALDDEERTVHTLERACERVLVASDQQVRLIDALFTLAHSQRGLKLRSPIDLADAFGDALRSRQPEARGRGLRVSAGLASATALGDARLAERLAVNLVANAISHNIPGGWIEIATGESGGSAFLSVANSGGVIPPAEVQRLFEPFQRLGAERVGQNGFGLGLSIVKAIVDAHDAQLSATALPGGGLEIKVRFPRIPVGLSARNPSPPVAVRLFPCTVSDRGWLIAGG
jgi:signal transduction histidine kinase